MCNTVYLSTDRDDDLTVHDHATIRFERVALDGPARAVLPSPNRWHVHSSAGCGCAFRHLSGDKPWFGAPEEWDPEDDVDIEATRRLYRVIYGLRSAGGRVECLDSWNHEDLDRIVTRDVDLAVVGEAEFRLFEGHLFRFT